MGFVMSFDSCCWSELLVALCLVCAQWEGEPRWRSLAMPAMGTKSGGGWVLYLPHGLGVSYPDCSQMLGLTLYETSHYSPPLNSPPSECLSHAWPFLFFSARLVPLLSQLDWSVLEGGDWAVDLLYYFPPWCNVLHIVGAQNTFAWLE